VYNRGANYRATVSRTVINACVFNFFFTNIVKVCAFEKRAPDFKSKGAKVFGVSSGGPADKDKFIRANKLQSMELLIDEGDKLRTSWKVPRALFGAFPGRVTYVVGKDGLVKSVYDDLGNAALHPDKALSAL
jgi:peroxiredoxin Q/BCP